jgi:hypothetical protein
MGGLYSVRILGLFFDLPDQTGKDDTVNRVKDGPVQETS